MQNCKELLGVPHKPRGQLRGEEVRQMTIVLIDHEWGGGAKNTQKTDHVVYGSLLKKNLSQH